VQAHLALNNILLFFKINLNQNTNKETLKKKKNLQKYKG
jgi:hypothetical protein